MDKKLYILTQFRRTWNKKYENYCIERLITKLDDLNLQFVTQQMFRLNGGDIALADLFFPQLNLAIEIDEEYHKTQEEQDKLRQKEIEEKMNRLETIFGLEPEIRRIDAGTNQTIEDINRQIDELVDRINKKKSELAAPLSWQCEDKKAADYLNQSVIKADDRAYFKEIVDVAALFGKGYKKGARKSYFKVDKNAYCWCPQLKMENENRNIPFENAISTDENTIFESSDENNDAFVSKYTSNDSYSKEIRYAFPRYLVESGEYRYVFKGVYTLNVDRSKAENKRVWERQACGLDLQQFLK